MRRVAIPITEGKLSEMFGSCSHYEIYELGSADAVVKRLGLPDVESVKQLPQWVKEQGVTDIIAYKMDKDIIALFTENKINVFLGAPVESPDLLIEEFINGNLRSREKIIKEIFG